MEGEAAAAVVQVLVQNLIDVTKNEISLFRGLETEATKLAERLGTLQEFLNDAEKRTISGGDVKSWLKRLEDVAFDADNVLDELSYHRLSKQIKPITPKPMKQKVLSCFNSIARPRNMALRIQEINKKLESIYQEGGALGLQKKPAADVSTSVGASFETDAFTDDPIFIGRDEVMSEIVENLATSITSGERKISILAIVGMGGLGKTTLTRKVFHHEKTQALFGSHIWVHVSQIFDPMVLFKKILKELTSSDKVEAEMSRQDIVKKLKEALKDKTYLLVLDDVWNDDLPKWEDFIKSLSGATSIKGNAIVITTRSTEVASTVSPLHTHDLERLSEDDCWSIMKKKVFGKDAVPSDFEATGRKIATRCKGLPLAANVVGGVLRNKPEEKWITIEREWLSGNDGDHITKILRLSFDNLSRPSLKKCFAYCSVFPKGRRIEKKKLIECWMAEGFLDAYGSNEMESVGDKFINILLHNSLLQVAEGDYDGDLEGCVMHDLVHDLAYSVLGSSDNVDGMSRIRYISHEDESSPISKEMAKYLRTLFFEGEIYGNMFSDFESLHALTLHRYEVKELPSSIRKLIHLRILDIDKTRIKYLPDWIGELVHLQTLRAETSYLRQRPSTLKYLINLRHLYIYRDVELPAEIGRLTSLQTLKHFKVGDKNGFKIEELGSLNNLKGELNIWNLERVHNKEEAEKANLSKKSKILKLCLRWDIFRKVENDEEVLEGLQPHSDLKKLEIWGFQGKRFPSWTLNMGVGNVGQGSLVPLNNLIKIRLSSCSECEEIPMFGQLPNLKSLELYALWNVKFIDSSFYGLVNEETRVVFPALEKLVLDNMPKLAEWAEVELAGASDVKVFPHLKHLMIKWIGSYKLLANIFQTKLTLLTELCLEGIYDLEYLPDWLFCNIPNLSELEIRRCFKLRGLVDGLGTLNSLKENGLNLERLIISECPNLERIGYIGLEQSQGSLTSLRSLEITQCDALLYLPCEMVGSSLEKLSLKNLSSLKNLPEIVDCLPRSPRLKHLAIGGFPEFMTTCFIGIRPPHNLQFLDIDFSMGGSMEIVDGLLQGCGHSLGDLILKGKEGWENLPESIQHLTALSGLVLNNLGMEELPEWFGNLSSLTSLDLYNCKKLRRLHAMRRLKGLQFLHIIDSPELRIEQESEAADSQWPNISHIPYITINGSKPHAVDSKETRRKHTCLSGCL